MINIIKNNMSIIVGTMIQTFISTITVLLIVSLYFTIFALPFFIKKCNAYSIHGAKMPGFLQNSKVHHYFHSLLENDFKKPILLDGDRKQSNFKKEFCESITKSNKLEFIDTSFDNFMIQMPHINNKNSVIYIDDFYIGNGRILNSYEEMIISSFDKESNLIILNSDDIDRIIFKDINIIKHYPIIRFPTINKNDINKYISYTILKYKYKDLLYNINWTLYDFSKMNFEKINILLFEVNNIITEKNYKYINNFIIRAISDISNIY